MSDGLKQAQNVTQPCSGCLGAGRMYDMTKYKLMEPYLLLTGLKISETDGLPHHLCQICSTLLVKYTNFRKRCHQSLKYFEDVKYKQTSASAHVTKEIIPQYTMNNVLLISYLHQNDSFDNNDVITDTIDDNDVITDTIDGNDVMIKHDYDGFINNYDIEINDCDRKDEIPNKILNETNFIDVKKEVQDNHQVFTDKNGKHNHKAKKIKMFNIENNVLDLKIVTNTDANICNKKTQNIKTKGVIKLTIDNQTFMSSNEKNIIKKEQIKTKKSASKTKACKEPFKLSTEEGRQIFAKKYGLNIEVMSEEEKKNDVYEKYSDIKGGSKCMLCYKSFKNEDLLRVHKMEKHDASKPQCCGYCGYRTDTRRVLQYHIVRNHKYKFTCLTCGLLIRTPTAIAEHHRTHSGQTFTCRFCGILCKKSKHYRLHLRKVHPCELTWCNICGEVFINLENHLKASHKEELKPELRCTNCNAYFLNTEAMDKHDTHTNAQTDKRMQCDKPCFHCGDGFINEIMLRHHFDVQHKQTQNTAKETKKSLDLSENKKNFVNNGGGMCDVCGKIIHSRQGMEYHTLIHIGALPHACEHCGKRFRNKMSLKNHCRIHSGERPYSCVLCQKAFSSQAGLYRHRRVHTGEKKYECNICKNHYSSSSTLKVHVKSVHMKMRYK